MRYMSVDVLSSVANQRPIEGLLAALPSRSSVKFTERFGIRRDTEAVCGPRLFSRRYLIDLQHNAFLTS